MQTLLSNAASGLRYQEECNIVGKICEDNVHAFKSLTQATLLPKFCEESDL